MRRNMYIFTPVMIAVVGLIFFRNYSKIDIDAPRQIVIEKGEGFRVDDYVTVTGGKGTTAEYIDNINIDKEGVYSLTIIAENSMGNSVTKEIEVVVQ